MIRSQKNRYLLPGLGMLLIALLIVLVPFLQRDSYSKISDLHIQQLSELEVLEVLDYKINNEMDKPIAYIFYKRGVKVGAYWLRIKNDEMEYGADLMQNENKEKSVQVFGVRTGFPYLMIQIHDKQLLQEGKYIYATFNQKTWYRLDIEEGKRAYTLAGNYDEGAEGNSFVLIYNQEQQIIYEWPTPPPTSPRP
ncbi:hypothetical protein [Paenibacillus senegalimassiliensis]|uniref:hypothetical protein n=1 Tax=Paenibacillus senegalimassiliensis TaxID=1737426 RepID=UPI00073EC56A|nr:hypothetical protein [Paenibacillus senegalimassiliensis]